MAARRRAVVWAASARDALDEVVAYIPEDSRDRAVQVLARALDVADSLETLAERGRRVPELDDPSIREIFVYRYRLLY
jgi:toxin ParE1/3/4